MQTALNKDAVAGIAVEAGLSVPDSVTIERAQDLPRARALRFPCVCKPVFGSQWRKPGIWDAVGRQKAVRLASFEELKDFYAKFSHIDPLVGVHEWVDGGETNLQMFGSYCSPAHEPVAYFTARKRLQYPPLAGTGIVVEALPLPELVGPAKTLLSALKFRGMSEIEFKRDQRNGRLYLIEINPRHWDQHGLGALVGVNLSEALYRDATGQHPRPMTQSAESTIWIAEAEYLRHLGRVARGRAPVQHASVAFGGRRAFSILDRADMGPFLSLFGWRPSRERVSVR
jgi:predicted ATP-grasp superfamily ATP-dependent carboligase